MKEIVYKGKKCLIVFKIPMYDSKGKKQGDQDRVYLSHPFNFSVPQSEIK